MWAMVSYIASLSGESMMDDAISFEEAAMLRPDGGHNICYATVETSGLRQQKYFDSMQRWFGPYGIRKNDLTIWRIDSEWSKKRFDDLYAVKIHEDLKLIQKALDGQALTAEEWAQLIEHGIMKSADGEMQCLWIEGAKTQRMLLEIGDRIRQKHFDEMNALRKTYVDAVLKQTPEHLRTMQEDGLPFTFYVDGWFILHCMKELVNGGKLRQPAEEQRRSLTTIIVHE